MNFDKWLDYAGNTKSIIHHDFSLHIYNCNISYIQNINIHQHSNTTKAFIMLNRAHCHSWPRKKKQNPRLFLVYNTDTKIDIQLFFCLNDHHITFFTSKILVFSVPKMQNNFLCLVFFWMCMFACPTICFPWLVLTTCCTIT